MSYLVTLELEELTSVIDSKYGISVETVMDTTEPQEIEIVVDKTNRRNNINFDYYDSYMIEYINNKIYIDGGQNYAIVAAIKKLEEIILNNYQLKDGTKIVGKSTEGQQTAGYSYKNGDEFGTNKLSSLWTVSNATESTNSGSLSTIKRTGNKENLNVSNGYLNEYITKDSDSYQAARVQTNDSLWFQYGYVEISAKIPNGSGFHSAFYLYGLEQGNPKHPEFDIMESYGDGTAIQFTPFAHNGQKINADGDEVRDSYIHWNANENFWTKSFYNLENNDSFSNEYHTFGLEWTESVYKFIVDGRVIVEIDYTECEEPYKSIYQQPAYVMLGCSAGITTMLENNNPDDSFSALANGDTNISNNFSIDYFHLYQTSSQKSSNSSVGF